QRHTRVGPAVHVGPARVAITVAVTIPAGIDVAVTVAITIPVAVTVTIPVAISRPAVLVGPGIRGALVGGVFAAAGGCEGRDEGEVEEEGRGTDRGRLAGNPKCQCEFKRFLPGLGDRLDQGAGDHRGGIKGACGAIGRCRGANGTGGGASGRDL